MTPAKLFADAIEQKFRSAFISQNRLELASLALMHPQWMSWRDQNQSNLLLEAIKSDCPHSDVLASKALARLADCDERCALHWAAIRGNDPALRELLLLDLPLEARDSYGKTPLLYACEYAHPACAKLLAEAGASKDARDPMGNSAMMLACLGRDRAAIAKCLVDSNFDADATNNRRQNALHFCALYNEQGAIRLLADSKKVNALDDSGNTPLNLALESSKEQAACAMLLYADMKAKNRAGLTPLELAEKRKLHAFTLMYSELDLAQSEKSELQRTIKPSRDKPSQSAGRAGAHESRKAL